MPLTEEEVEALMAAEEAEIDVEDEVVRFTDREVHFDTDPDVRQRLLNGLGDLGIMLQTRKAIERYDEGACRPMTTAL